jgi:predicted DNA-binding ribbon-helix-helix protein
LPAEIVQKHSVTINGHRTSVSLEHEFYDELVTMAEARGVAFAALVAEIDSARSRKTNLSSALRLFVLADFKRRSR